MSALHAGVLRRKCACGGEAGPAGECEARRSKREGAGPRRTPRGGGSGPRTAPPIVAETLRSPGRPLAPSVRAAMEARFGHDFGAVRVHTDARAAESARAVNALAYTVARDVVFAAGQYAPGNREGQRLLAHELAHTVQQGHGEAAMSGLPLTSPRDRSEREAASAAERAAGGLTVGPLPPARAAVARQVPPPTVTLDPFHDPELDNPYRAPGEEQAEEFRRATISVVRDPILAALRRSDAIDFLNRLRALDAEDRAQLEGDAAFMGEIHRVLRGMSFWIVQLILHFGNERPLYVRQLSLAVSARNVQLIIDLLRTYNQLRDPDAVPGVREMLDYELRGVPERAAVLAVAGQAEEGGRSSISATFHEAHYEIPKGGGAYQLQKFTGTTGFTLARTASELRVIVRIHLVEAKDASKTFYPDDRTEGGWRRGIESAWNGRFTAANGATRLRVVFVPLFTEDLPDHTVAVDPGRGRSDEGTWYLQSVDGAVIAHEFGHMVGNPDEYRLPGTTAEIPASMGLSPQEALRSSVQGVTGTARSVRAGGYSLAGIMGQTGGQVALPRHVGPVMDLFNRTMLRPGEAPYHLE